MLLKPPERGSAKVTPRGQSKKKKTISFRNIGQQKSFNFKRGSSLRKKKSSVSKNSQLSKGYTEESINSPPDFRMKITPTDVI